MYTMLASSETHPRPGYSREVRLRARSTGLPTAEHFTVVSLPEPTPAAGDVLLQNRYFRVSASLRMMMSEGAEAVEGVPFPALRPGDTLAEEALGEVITAPAGSGLSRGDLVLHHCGFREIAAVPVSACQRVDDTLPDPVAYLGHGWTAYAVLTRAAHVRAGDTVFVSSAAGSIGSMAARIARRLGAARIIGSTSTLAKGKRLVSELGYDAAVTREGGPLLAQLRSAAPDGIDVALDNVGGEQLQAAVQAARRGARIIVVGALSGQLAEQGTGRSAPAVLDSFPILLGRVTIRGYSADDDADARPEWNRLFGAALRAGELQFPHVRIRGLEQAPQALCDVMRGHHLGTVIVEV